MQTKKIKIRKSLKFPDGFLWGSATSAYQVEGGIMNNDWAAAQAVPRAGSACDHYRRFPADFALAKKLNQNAHRLSLEWSRIEPERGKWNEEELHHYFHVLKELKEKRFTIFLTLHHFTNPVWVSEQGGWKKRRVIDDFSVYAAKVVQTFGQFVDFWVTINEPNVYAAMAFGEGIWPPFERNVFNGFRVYRNMLEAHNRAYEIIHGYYPDAKVGFAQNIAFYEPANPGNFMDRLIVKIARFLEEGYPYERTQNDFIGLNYYFHHHLKFSFSPQTRFFKFADQPKNKTDRGWDIYPEGLRSVLAGLRRLRKPIYITENGLADAEDAVRVSYVAGHLRAVHRALRQGVPVRGYFYWSLLDNFEWEDGYKWKFGLVSVDPKTLKRRVRKSAREYAKICKNNGLA